MKLDQSEDNQIANIYEKVLKGDKNALNNLQKINNSPFKKQTNVLSRQLNSIQQKPEKKPQDINKASKTQNFKKYLHEKVAQFRSVNQASKKQLGKIQKVPQKNQYIQTKPFSKVPKRPDVKSQQKAPQIVSTKQIRQIEEVRKKEKTKTTFANFQQNINKNIIKDSVTQKDKRSTPPSSNHSFRVRLQGGGKKLLEQLIKINEQERKLQLQILQLHKQNKQFIAQVCQKNSIPHLDKNYPKIVQIIQDYKSFSLDSPSIIKIKQKSANINVQQQKILKLQKQIAVLSTQIQSKKTQCSKRQAKLEGLPLYTYMNSVPDIFEQQRQSQQENEEIGELPAQNRNIDPTKTYQSLMVEMKKKKWGLNQRINYQSEGLKNNESKLELVRQKSAEKILQPSPPKIEGQKDSKIIVNSRLKQFLFE